ncbi:hypothetical protein JTE90_011282, partial [Oedothorax gibbosus]
VYRNQYYDSVLAKGKLNNYAFWH